MLTLVTDFITEELAEETSAAITELFGEPESEFSLGPAHWVETHHPGPKLGS